MSTTSRDARPPARRVAGALGALLLVSCGSDGTLGSRLQSETTLNDRDAGSDRETDSLAVRVADAYYRLVPSEAMSLGFNIEINDAGQAAMRDCFERKGERYLAPPDLVVRGSRPHIDSRERRSVEAGWAVPPNPAAAEFGLGLFVASPPDAELIPSEEWVTPSFADEAAERTYHEVAAECGASVSPASSSGFDSTLMDALNAEFLTIERDTEKTSGFADLRARYEACLVERDLPAHPPRDLLQVLEDSGLIGEPAAKFEVDLAVGDAVCRLPLYEEFIALNAAAWESWLERRAGDIVNVEQQFDRYENIALAAWSESGSR